MMMKVILNYRHGLFAIVGLIFILWGMFLHGYILTLDLVFSPNVIVPIYSGIDAIKFPYQLLFYIFQLLLSGWIVEKLLLACLFFLLFYLPLRFYPFTNKHGESYFVSLLFVINPFVYERFLSGHIGLLLAYAFLFPFVVCLIRFYKELAWRPIVYAGFWLLGIGVFSLHLLVISAFVWMTFGIGVIGKMVLLKKYRLMKVFLLRSGAVIMLVVGISLYWIIPAMTTSDNRITEFTPAHWDAFKTVGDPFIGTVGNVAALYGFWEENEMWGAQFVTPKDNGWLWGISGIGLSGVILIGLIGGLRRRSTRFLVAWIALIGGMSLVFSTGVGDSVFREWNRWLFQHIPFWQGFRDSQKWSALLALTYSLLGGLGVGYILSRIKKSRKMQMIMSLLLCSLPLLYTPTMLFGFNGQLHAVEYPKSWEQVNTVLKNDKKCKAIFLPWHLYYSLSFNNNILTANTASKYFNCTIYNSENAEIGDVGYTTNMPREYYEVAKEITNNKNDPDRTIRFFADHGIKYIIYTSDIAGEDPYDYPFLRSHLIKKVVEKRGIALFKIDVYN